MLETSALKLFTVANLHYQLSCCTLSPTQHHSFFRNLPPLCKKELKGWNIKKERQKNRQAKKQVTHPCTTCRQTAIYIKKKKKNWTHLSCVLTSMTWLVNNLGFPKQAFSMDTLSFITCNSNKGKCAKNTPWRALWRNEKKLPSELFLHVVC